MGRLRARDRSANFGESPRLGRTAKAREMGSFRSKFAWVLGGGCAWACIGEDPWTNEDTGEVQQELPKGRPGAVNGDADYCKDPAFKCVKGEGDCDTDTNCTTGNVCGIDNGPGFGFPALYDVCVPPHCRNKVKDADETKTDCGGADCGTSCGYLCTGLPANGTTAHCSLDCPCPAGEGDCANNAAKCQSGLICAVDVGVKYGLAATVDVCESAHCNNGVKDSDETGVDCGGTQCKSCTTPSFGSNRYGGATFDAGKTVAISINGTYLLAGRFTTTANFGGTNLTTAGGSSSASDVFIAKYSSAGAHLWSKRFGAQFSDGDLNVGAAIDGTGGAVLVGNFAGTVNFGGGNKSSNGGSYDAFIVRLDANGNFVWANTFGGTDLDRFDKVAFDRDGTIIAVGAFKGAASFGGATLTSAGDYDVVVAKFNPTTGAHVWSQRFGSTLADIGTDVVVDYNHDVDIVGQFGGTVSFGSTSLTSAGSTDAFIAHLARLTGAPTWAKRFGGASNDAATAVTVDQSLRPVVSGYFKATANFGGGNITVAGSGDRTDAFTVALDANGNYRWARSFGGTDHDQALGVTANATGEVAVTGYMRGTVANFAADGSSTTSAGGNDVFVIRYGAAAGATLSSVRYGGTGDDMGLSITNAGGKSYVTGSFTGAVNFGGTMLTSAGDADVFLTKLTF